MKAHIIFIFMQFISPMKLHSYALLVEAHLTHVHLYSKLHTLLHQPST